jgi:Fe-S cluster assembly iron-binding protein IscA
LVADLRAQAMVAGRYKEGTMIEVTERAAQQFKSVIHSKSLPDETMLRVDIDPESGSAGHTKLLLKLDMDEPGPQDDVTVSQGVRLAVDKSISENIGDRTLDYQEDEGVFVFAGT